MLHFRILVALVFIFAVSSSGQGGEPESIHKPSVIGGGPAEAEAYPWMAAIYLHRFGPIDIAEDQVCGGVLIHPYWVLTAAHCVAGIGELNSIRVTVGGQDLSAARPGEKPALILLHPDYLHGIGPEADLALIRLENPIADAATLSINTDVQLAAFLGAGTILGWGLTEPLAFDQTGPSRLQQVVVPFVDRAIVNASGLFDNRVSERMIAAGASQPLRTGYLGDSGGPLLARGTNDGPDRLLGIASFGAACEIEAAPFSIYIDIAYHADWIRDAISEHSMRLYPDHRYLKAEPSTAPAAGFSLAPAKSGSPKPAIDFASSPSSDRFAHVFSYAESGTAPGWSHRAFEPFLESWRIEAGTGRLIRTIDGSTFGPTETLILRADERAQPTRGHGPFPIGAASRVQGTFFGASFLQSKPHGDYLHVFELRGYAGGDTLALTASVTNGRQILFGIFECDESGGRWAAENLTDFSYAFRQSHRLSANVKDGARYYAVAQNPGPDATAYELAYWINDPAIVASSSIQGTLAGSDSSLSIDGYRFDGFSIPVPTPIDKVAIVSADFEGVLQVYERDTARVVASIEVPPDRSPRQLVFMPLSETGPRILGVRMANAKPGAYGAYQLSVADYTKPASIAAGQTQNRAITYSSSQQAVEGETIYFDIVSVSPTPVGRVIITVRGSGAFAPAFEVVDRASGVTVGSGIGICPDAGNISFTAQAGRNYDVIIAGPASDLNGNYCLKVEN